MPRGMPGTSVGARVDELFRRSDGFILDEQQTKHEIKTPLLPRTRGRSDLCRSLAAEDMSQTSRRTSVHSTNSKGGYSDFFVVVLFLRLKVARNSGRKDGPMRARSECEYPQLPRESPVQF